MSYLFFVAIPVWSFIRVSLFITAQLRSYYALAVMFSSWRNLAVFSSLVLWFVYNVFVISVYLSCTYLHYFSSFWFVSIKHLASQANWSYWAVVYFKTFSFTAISVLSSALYCSNFPKESVKLLCITVWFLFYFSISLSLSLF